MVENNYNHEQVIKSESNQKVTADETMTPTGGTSARVEVKELEQAIHKLEKTKKDYEDEVTAAKMQGGTEEDRERQRERLKDPKQAMGDAQLQELQSGAKGAAQHYYADPE